MKIYRGFFRRRFSNCHLSELSEIGFGRSMGSVGVNLFQYKTHLR